MNDEYKCSAYDLTMQDLDGYSGERGDGVLDYVLERNPKAYRRLNLRRAEFVGDGIHCYTFRVSKTRVVKLTMNPHIARANEHVRRNPHRNICKVYDVFKIANTPLYAIRTEYLVSVNNLDNNTANTIMRRFTKKYDSMLDLLASYGFRGPGVTAESDAIAPHNMFTTRSLKTFKLADLGFLYLPNNKGSGVRTLPVLG